MSIIETASFVHVHVPPTTAGDDRTILLLHGTGGNERDLLELGVAVAPGTRLLGVRGQVLEGGAPRFFRRMAEGVFDEADIIRRAADLAAFVPAAAATYGFDPKSVTALGFSNGANIAAAMLLLHPGVLAGAIMLRSMVPLVPATPPDLTGTRALMIQGLSDPLIPRENAERLAAMLQGAGASVSVEWQQGGHGLTPADVPLARTWLSAQG
ncbi:MAG TPA: alpha/beta hydrolase [Gemmatimonadaceae bacterium]|nr:alpha/beta hydrolase [Gemmatimonadaceae bacterium]